MFVIEYCAVSEEKNGLAAGLDRFESHPHFLSVAWILFYYFFYSSCIFTGMMGNLGTEMLIRVV